MKKFIAIYYAPWSSMKDMAAMSPEEKQAGMKPWMDWMEKHKIDLVDGGAPLMPAQAIAAEGTWTDSAKQVTGYSILQAADMESAKKLFDGHPHLAWSKESSIELSEFASM